MYMDVQIDKKAVRLLMEDLVALGEDRGEMNMWYALYNLMSEDEKRQLSANLENELKELKKAIP